MFISDQSNSDSDSYQDYYIIESFSTMDSETRTCSICLENIENNNKMINPCCKQYFCSTCIYDNISSGNTNCPLCRHDSVIYNNLYHDNCKEVDTYVNFLENKLESLSNDIKYLKKKNKKIKKINNKILNKHLYYQSLLLVNEIIDLDDKHMKNINTFCVMNDLNDTSIVTDINDID